jgi:guanyl-specific ribonuclease Sa
VQYITTAFSSFLSRFIVSVTLNVLSITHWLSACLHSSAATASKCGSPALTSSSGSQTTTAPKSNETQKQPGSNQLAQQKDSPKEESSDQSKKVGVSEPAEQL